MGCILCNMNAGHEVCLDNEDILNELANDICVYHPELAKKIAEQLAKEMVR